MIALPNHTSTTAVARCCLVTILAVGAPVYALTIFGLGSSASARLRRSDPILVPFCVLGVASIGVKSPGLRSIAALDAAILVSGALSERAR
jgi:hypothetical protein